jgi:hypothetical protein
MRYVITTDTEFSEALDYLPVAARAYDRNRESDILWAESIAVHRAVLDYADAALTETIAAGVQATVGAILRIAELPPSLDFRGLGPAGHPMLNDYAVRSERAKNHIRGLIAAR